MGTSGRVSTINGPSYTLCFYEGVFLSNTLKEERTRKMRTLESVLKWYKLCSINRAWRCVVLVTECLGMGKLGDSRAHFDPLCVQPELVLSYTSISLSPVQITDRQAGRPSVVPDNSSTHLNANEVSYIEQGQR